MTQGEGVDVFFCGDVMTGRGIDQILPHPSDPELREPLVRNALDYVALAKRESGPIPRPVPFTYPWGEALDVLDSRAPDVRLINLETSVTGSDDFEPKGINYRMHPKNVATLTAARIDCCVLSNNHVLDFGVAGLEETLRTLAGADLELTGAGSSEKEARAPAVVRLAGGRRVLVFGLGTTSSGIPPDWAAEGGAPGVRLLPDLSEETADGVAGDVEQHREPGDVVIASLHWGGNWGYDVARSHRKFAHLLIDRAGVDLVHGHSSHHARGLEVYRERLIVYGCGDFINDYEGIGGHEEYRDDLTLMYFARLAPRLESLRMVPMQIRKFRLAQARERDIEWIRKTLDRQSEKLGCRVARAGDGDLVLRVE